MRKTRIVALASASLACLAPTATAAPRNVVYTVIGTFATTVVSGPDLLKLAGQPFSIAILASESLKPTTHTKTSATYSNVYLAGTLQAGFIAYSIPISSAGAALTLQIGAAGGPDQASVQFSFVIEGVTVTVSGMVTMPAGTLTTLAIRPFTTPVAFTTSNASATYACTICASPTTLAIASGSVNAALSGVTTLYSFTGGDGANPYAGLILGKHGEFYGTTNFGGLSNFGTVFELTPPASSGAGWTETALYSFQGGSDGASPDASLVLSPTGALYGTTYSGGASNSGTVFELTPPAASGGAWKETVVYSFNNQGGDGYAPRAALVIGPGGVLYGTTYYGGTSGYGTAFALVPPASHGGQWKETVLYSFTGQNGDGAIPYAPLIIGANGSLYGTTESGGTSNNFGTVFELTPPAAAGNPWTETILYRFTQSDGAYPYAGLSNGPNGSLYGTTSSGGAAGFGVVFELTPPAAAGGAWTESILYSFTGRPATTLGSTINGDGATPYSGLVMDTTGALYGTTYAGGAAGGGTAFKLTPPSTPGSAWTETVLATFLGPVGTGPTSSLAFGPKGQLYGAAEYGGNGSCSNGYFGCGTVVELQP